MSLTVSCVGKYETVGSFAVSTLLITGGIAIGLHSFDLLTAVLNTTTTAPSAVESVANTISSVSTSSVDATAVDSSNTSPENSSALSSTMSSVFHMHHHHSTSLDPNAAWFALASVVIKEWLYHASKTLKRMWKGPLSHLSPSFTKLWR